MKRIILDTNFLLIPMQFKVDIFSEIERICMFPYELYILDKTVGEIRKIIKEQSGKSKEAAKVALQLVEKKRLNIVKTSDGKVDDLILSLLDKDTILATQDELLIKRAAAKGSQLIMLRSKKYLVIK